jgi:hypothetical protein
MYAILIYGFPLLLLIFEWGLRTIIQVDSSGFTGPTLAAAGLSYLMPLTKPKILDIPIPGMLGNAVVTSKADQRLVGLVWLIVLSTLFAWAASCYMSIKHPSETMAGVSAHFFIGGVTYVVSLIMTAIKERT